MNQAPPELYAAYLEMVDSSDGAGYRRRVQYIIFPQLPARLAPGDSPVTSHLCYFTREQRNEKHRAIWSFRRDTAGEFKENLALRVQRYADAGWTISPMITCELDPTELAQVIKEQKTPYRILNRLKKVARGMYRLDIS